MARHSIIATLVAPLVAMLWLSPALVAAQSASDTKAAADALFDEGKQLVKAGDLGRACEKFAASLQLLDQLGVRLNLADCHERQGQTATAWAEFREAASLAEKRHDRRAAPARQRADALAPRLVKLQISVPPASRRPGLVVRRDGAPVPSEAFDSPLPVNPGKYTIEATATGSRSWSTEVDASKPGEVVTIEIPALVAAAPPVEPKPPGSPARAAPAAAAPGPGPGAEHKPDEVAATDGRAQHRRHLVGIGVGAGGLAAIGVGVVLGFEAKSKWDSAGAHCTADHVCDPTGVSINHSAQQLGTAGTIVGSVGAAALIAGAVLYVTAPAARPVIEHARLDVDRSAGLQVSFAARF
jgi:hypothetical protein